MKREEFSSLTVEKFSSLTVDELWALRSEISAVLASRIATEKTKLERFPPEVNRFVPMGIP